MGRECGGLGEGMGRGGNGMDGGGNGGLVRLFGVMMIECVLEWK